MRPGGVAQRVIEELLSVTKPLHGGAGSGGTAGFSSDGSRSGGLVTDTEAPRPTGSYDMSTDLKASADQKERSMPELGSSANRADPPGLPSFDTEGPWIAIEDSSIKGTTRPAKPAPVASEPSGMDDWNRLSSGAGMPKAGY